MTSLPLVLVYLSWNLAQPLSASSCLWLTATCSAPRTPCSTSHSPTLLQHGASASLRPRAAQDEDALSISPAWLTALLALLASATAALVASAGVRLAKGYELAVRPPQGAAEIAGAPWAQQALLHCSLVLPVLTVLLWVSLFIHSLQFPRLHKLCSLQACTTPFSLRVWPWRPGLLCKGTRPAAGGRPVADTMHSMVL